MATRIEENIGNYSFGDWKNQNEPRVNFIIKMYSILTMQTFTSTLLCILSLMYDSIYEFQSKNIWLLAIFVLVILTLNLIQIWYKDHLRDNFISYFIVIIYTIAQAYVVSYICLTTNPKLILMLIFMSFAFIFALTLFCEITKNEFALISGMIFCSCISLLLFIIFLFISDYNPLLILLSSLWVILYGMYIIYDTLLMLGNKENNLHQNEYILASFSFYTDIFIIFASMFQIVSYLRELKDDDK